MSPASYGTGMSATTGSARLNAQRATAGRTRGRSGHQRAPDLPSILQGWVQSLVSSGRRQWPLTLSCGGGQPGRQPWPPRPGSAGLGVRRAITDHSAGSPIWVITRFRVITQTPGDMHAGRTGPRCWPPSVSGWQRRPDAYRLPPAVSVNGQGWGKGVSANERKQRGMAEEGCQDA